jgi:uncharacterized membrane protein YebE (DUF533 family)
MDARNILDALMKGGAQPQGQQGSFGNLGDLLRQFSASGQAVGGDGGQTRLSTAERGSIAPAATPGGGQRPSDEGGDAARTGSLEDMLGKVMAGQGSLGDIVGRLQQQGGGLAEILGRVLGQATSGMREGAGRIDEATGASRHAREAMAQATGRLPEEVLAQLKELIGKNQLGAGAALGGLGALVLGTRTGRSLAGSAVKLGSLALIGGLAYKAYENYQQGQPILTGGAPQAHPLSAAPEGSGFESSAVTDENAKLLIRAMIAAAAADGRIDEREQQTIIGSLKQARLDGEAQQFLARELDHPATVDELAKAVSSPAQAAQVYTAARIAVDPRIEEEHAFLAALAGRLGIDEQLAAHIDAVARSAGT